MNEEVVKHLEILQLKIEMLELIINETNTKVNETNYVLINHINFINSVYSHIKRPFLFIMNKIGTTFMISE